MSQNIFCISNLTPDVDAGQVFPEMYSIRTRTVYEDAACTPTFFSGDETRFNRAECSINDSTGPTPKLIDLVLGPDCSVPSTPTEVAYKLVGSYRFSAELIRFKFANFFLLSNVTFHYYCSGTPHQLHIDNNRGDKFAVNNLTCGDVMQRKSLTTTLNSTVIRVSLHAKSQGGHLFLTEVQFSVPRRGMFSCYILIILRHI